MKVAIQLTGVERLLQALDKSQLRPKIQQVVRENGAMLMRRSQDHAHFRGHYEWRKGQGRVFIKSTGETRRSIQLKIFGDGMGASVFTPKAYAPYLEYGTRFMEAQPFMRPAFDEVSEKFIRDIERVVKS